MSKKDDFYLAEEVKQGNVDAYKYLIDRHKDMVFSIILRIVRIKEDAEELAQDVFIKVYKSIASFKGKSKFSTWIYRIAYNTAISHTRKKQFNTVEIEESICTNDEIFETYNEFIKKEDNDKEIIIRKALRLLNEDEELLVTLYYLNEIPVKEITQITGLSNSNVKVKLFRARNKLYSILSEQKELIFTI